MAKLEILKKITTTEGLTDNERSLALRSLDETGVEALAIHLRCKLMLISVLISFSGLALTCFALSKFEYAAAASLEGALVLSGVIVLTVAFGMTMARSFLCDRYEAQQRAVSTLSSLNLSADAAALFARACPDVETWREIALSERDQLLFFDYAVMKVLQQSHEQAANLLQRNGMASRSYREQSSLA